jgi:hypothetical protein
MWGFLVFFAFIALIIFIMPFIISVAGFLLLFALVFMFLARIGLIPGMTYRRYTYTTTSRKPSDAPRTKPFRFDDDAPPSESGSDWFQSEQDGEIITLPETALKKDDEKSPSSP